jgi:hypothetical protein
VTQEELELKRKKKREYIREWRKKNPEKQRAIRKRGHLKFKERENADSRKWFVINKDKSVELAIKWKAANPDKLIKYKLTSRTKKYGINSAIYKEMLENQKGLCAICGKEAPKGNQFHIDHDHKTGIVRGLLCSFCNLGIGQLKHSIEILISAIEYLKINASK